MTKRWASCAAIGSLAIAPTLAGASELGTVRQPDGSIAPLATTIGLEVSPSFYASTNRAHGAGDYDDTSVKLTLSQHITDAFTIGGSLKDNIKQDGRRQYYVETKAGYKFDFGRFSLTPSAALGVTWNDTGFGPVGSTTAAYYAFYLAGDLKLSDALTWTVFDLRYRDAFDYIWVTPEVSTGLAYKLTRADQISGTASYSWKGVGNGLHADTYSVALGVSHSF